MIARVGKRRVPFKNECGAHGWITRADGAISLGARRLALLALSVSRASLAQETSAAPSPPPSDAVDARATSTVSPSKCDTVDARAASTVSPSKADAAASPKAPESSARVVAPADSGLFLRVAFGGGLLFDHLSSDDMPLLFDDGREARGVIAASLTGGAFAVDAFFGGITTPGLSLGVALQNQVSPSTESGDVQAAGVVAGERLESTTMAVSLLGPAFDYYPRAWGGFHLQAAFGFAFVQGTEVRWETRGKLLDDHSGSGAGVSLGTGYEWDLNARLTFGIYARVLYAGASGDSEGNVASWHNRVLAPTLGATMALH